MCRYLNVWFLSLGLLISASSPSAARSADFDRVLLQGDILKTIELVRPAVVRISSGGGGGFSGVIVSEEGHVLSAAHAVKPSREYQIALPDGRRFRGIGKGSDAKTDSALIKILEPGKDLPHIPMGDSSSLVANQPCLGLSYPGGQRAGSEPVVRFGRYIATSRSRGMLQSSVLMEPGDSGGALVDLNGCVIGIHSRIGPSMERNYEVPVNVYRELWSELNCEQSIAGSEVAAPRLGIRCTAIRDNEDEEGKGEGLKILSVLDNSLASKAGLNRDDTIVQIYGRQLQSVSDLRKALIDARDDGADSIKVRLERADKRIDLEIPFDVAREAAPRVPLPKSDLPDVPAPQGFDELDGLADQFAELEAKLDDACLRITSYFGEEKSRPITGTRVRGTRWVVSKSSALGQNPTAEADEKSCPLRVIGRDSENDLVLLEWPEIQTVGVDLDATGPEPSVGTFLLTPDEDGAGWVSVVGSPAFRSRKQNSRGYLGVKPATSKDNQGALLDEVNENGAAERAGLLAGDVITKLNDTIIRSRNELREFLSQEDPNAVITATLRRDEEELTKVITLGAVPSRSAHAANKMDKSGRRDGFQEVFAHDADLEPNECGGPLFDLDGKWVGLNIARNSRVRSYALPVSELKEFIRQASSKRSK